MDTLARRGGDGVPEQASDLGGRRSGGGRSLLALPLMALALQTGCYVEVDHVTDARPAFRRARAEAEKVQGRPGPAHRLNVLVYDPDDEKLVKLSLPMWVCRKIERKVDWDEDQTHWSEDEREDVARVRRTIKRHVRLEDIERAGLGLLVQIEDDDGTQVLIWLK